jgi:hypothetical protein
MGERRNYTDSNQPQRRDQLYEEHIKDPYQARGKLPEPTVCPDCSASFHKGRWQWASAPTGAHLHRCPACSRINDKAPAALLTLSGEFLSEHQTEIMNLVHNAEEKEKAEHPLERIMSVEQLPDSGDVQISYTGIHLAKSTGTALHHAYQGDFQFEYSERDSILRASWQR